MKDIEMCFLLEEQENEPTQQEQIFAYLVQLRDSNIVNMFGAVPYLVAAFKLSD